MKDLKEGLSSDRKADTTHMRRALKVYGARGSEYGDDKYERGNYRRATGDGPHTEPTAEDFKRFRAYLRAAYDHIDRTLDAMEMHLAYDPQLTDVTGMKRAAYAADTDVTPGAKVGASLLPHVAPAAASLNMAITQAVDCGLLPADPGAPWRRFGHLESLVEQVDALDKSLGFVPPAPVEAEVKTERDAGPRDMPAVPMPGDTVMLRSLVSLGSEPRYHVRSVHQGVDQNINVMITNNLGVSRTEDVSNVSIVATGDRAAPRVGDRVRTISSHGGGGWKREGVLVSDSPAKASRYSVFSSGSYWPATRIEAAP